jgi:tricorn protease
MPTAGYYRYPTICDDTVVFISEDDLWTVSAEGGRRPTLDVGLGHG